MIQFQLFSIQLPPQPEEVERLNHFLRSHRVVDIHKELVQTGNVASWTFCVQYHFEGSAVPAEPARRKKVDYKDVLSEEHFKLFQRFREVRKQVAEQEALPAYAVFTDEELSKIVQLENRTESSICSISGIGMARAQKYASFFVD